MAIVMLVYSGLPNFQWGNAILVATTISNRCTTSLLKNNHTPFGRFFTKSAHLKTFKPFGCTDLVHIPLQIRCKLDVTSKKTSLVGMGEGLLFYKLYCNATKILIDAQDVTFIEEPDKNLFVNDELKHYTTQDQGLFKRAKLRNTEIKVADSVSGVKIKYMLHVSKTHKIL